MIPRSISACFLLLGLHLLGQEVSKPRSPIYTEAETAEALAFHSNMANWALPPQPLSAKDLAFSADRSREFLLNNISSNTGDFLGDFSLRDGDYSSSNPGLTRQCFALHALADLASRRSNEQTRTLFFKAGNAIFSKNSTFGNNVIVPATSKTKRIDTLSAALLISSIAQFSSYQSDLIDNSAHKQMLTLSRDYLKTLRYLELPDGGWASSMNKTEKGIYPVMRRQGFTDGACLLAYCRALSRQGLREDLPERLEKLIPALVSYYTLNQWQQHASSGSAAEFCQFGTIALAEYSQRDAPHAKLAGDAAQAMGWWLVHSYKVESRPSNPADFVPALCAAYRVAKDRKDTAAMTALRPVIERMLSRQMSMQAGHPRFLSHIPWHIRWPHPILERQRGGSLDQTGNATTFRLTTTHWAVLGTLDALELFSFTPKNTP